MSLATAKLPGYATLAALAAFGALALRRPELAALAAPFVLVAALGLARADAPPLAGALQLERLRAVEGDVVPAELVVSAGARPTPLSIALAAPPGMALGLEGRGREVRGRPLRLLVEVPAGEARRLALAVRCERFGGYLLGEAEVEAQDVLGVRLFSTALPSRTLLRVYPRPELLRSLVRPGEPQALAGNDLARLRGEGIEFAELRPFVAGDRTRHVNWRASARRDGLWVNERHPERNADVVIFLDTFADPGAGVTGTVELAIRGAAGLVEHYLRSRDRVGLVGFGGLLRWIAPSMGRGQIYRILDGLIDTQIVHNSARMALDVVPARMLPPRALVVALTPLADTRAVDALMQLRARGFDLAVVEISPAAFSARPPGPMGALAAELWEMVREERRHRYRALGVPVVEWRRDEPLERALAEIREVRRSARVARISAR